MATRYCHPMTAAGSGHLGQLGEISSAGEPSAGEPSAGEPPAGEPSAGEPSAGEPAGEPRAAFLTGARVGHILVLGECLADIAPAPSPAPAVRDQPRQQLVAMPGGGPANIAVGLARLEVPCTFAGRFSRGGFGPWLRQNLTDNGLDLSFSIDTDDAATIALVTLDSRGRASYTFYGPATADWQWTKEELPQLEGPHHGRPAVSAVHTGSLVLALEPGATAITGWLTNLRQAGRVLISFDPNVRPGLAGDLSSFRDRLTTVVRSSHIVKASTEDVEAVYPGTSPGTVAEKWLSLGVPLVVITEGADGATAYHQNGASTHCFPPPIELADTIGAGDAFTSALLGYFAEQGLLSPGGIADLGQDHLRASVGQAVAAGALTCSRLGADPPNRRELARFLDEHG
jgi:fructokinase